MPLECWMLNTGPLQKIRVGLLFLSKLPELAFRANVNWLFLPLQNSHVWCHPLKSCREAQWPTWPWRLTQRTKILCKVFKWVFCPDVRRVGHSPDLVWLPTFAPYITKMQWCPHPRRLLQPQWGYTLSTSTPCRNPNSPNISQTPSKYERGTEVLFHNHSWLPL